MIFAVRYYFGLFWCRQCGRRAGHPMSGMLERWKNKLGWTCVTCYFGAQRWAQT